MSDSRIAETFQSTSEYFDAVTPVVWGPAGQALTFALGLTTGQSVLDACAGSGASALPAGRAVGPSGVVHAIDLADDLLELGRAKAAASALRNIDFVCADATEWEAPDAIGDGYDALACSYGIFFLPDMEADFARLVGLVRPGGRVGVTVWRKGALEEFGRAFFEVVEEFASARSPETHAHHGPLSAEDYQRHPIRRVETPARLSTWLEHAGCTSVQVSELSNFIPVTADFAWNLILGSGFRGGLSGYDDATRESIRVRFLELLTARGVDFVDATTLVATGERAS
ncbi:class I SAM-dependent methyltransferase [Rhodococcus sp. I2R]|uniref:class I SAM-dependent methyltransferase n=1 Tax=Rhodococcus sp. I2R TaxID=2855445 RepID=UPI001E6545B6|nr:class I SAM-dependent methyltransferase [Rhodococcus sp. I2R]MCC8926663.1 class I SAM-dependent methyltransferase [Rhodococcus sp. I2R]